MIYAAAWSSKSLSFRTANTNPCTHDILDRFLGRNRKGRDSIILFLHINDLRHLLLVGIVQSRTHIDLGNAVADTFLHHRVLQPAAAVQHQRDGQLPMYIRQQRDIQVWLFIIKAVPIADADRQRRDPGLCRHANTVILRDGIDRLIAAALVEGVAFLAVIVAPRALA